MSGSSPDNGNNIPLDIVEVVEQHGPVGKSHALAGAVAEEPHNAVPGLLRQNLGAVEEELRGGAVDRLAGADAVGVVLIAVGIAAVGDFPQLGYFIRRFPALSWLQEILPAHLLR